MTVTKAKQAIAEALEDLQRQGVWVQEITLTWETVGKPDAKKEGIDTAIKCGVELHAKL